jgi:hypothetical protein
MEKIRYEKLMVTHVWKKSFILWNSTKGVESDSETPRTSVIPQRVDKVPNDTDILNQRFSNTLRKSSESLSPCSQHPATGRFSSQMNPVHILKPHFAKFQSNTIHPSTPRSPKWSPTWKSLLLLILLYNVLAATLYIWRASSPSATCQCAIPW